MLEGVCLSQSALALLLCAAYSAGVSQQAQAAVIEAAQANGGITTTAGAMLQSLQSNLAAASIRVLSYCGLCFLLTSLVVLGDAALVAGLHVGGRMPLAVAFGITVGANIMMMLMLVMVLVIVHIRNATEARSLQDRLNSPQVSKHDGLQTLQHGSMV